MDAGLYDTPLNEDEMGECPWKSELWAGLWKLFAAKQFGIIFWDLNLHDAGVGALIIKELFQISDDEIVENLMLDPRYQYALHTTSYEDQSTH